MNENNLQKDIYILGISCFYHDAAAALIKNGEVIAAAQEERFTRKKQDDGFPTNAINYCLEFAGIEAKDLHSIAYYEKPFVKFERLLYSYIKTWPIGLNSFLKAMSVWLKEKLWIPSTIKKELKYDGDIFYVEHHLSHAASAYFASPFEKAAILTIDGVGEWATTTCAIANENKIEITKEIHFPDSLGLLYSAFTYYLGFKVNSGEYKVMGLAPYGQPKYADQVRKLIDVKDDGSFKLNMKYFAYEHGLRMTNKHFHKLFGAEPRKAETPIDQRIFDIASSLQQVLEEIILKMANKLQEETGMENLCLAGGVALNCVANGVLLRESKFKNIYIQPAAGDAGGAVGAAFLIANTIANQTGQKHPYKMDHVYLGPDFSPEKIREMLESQGVKYEIIDDEILFDKVADDIDAQKVVGWFQGRMEYGPRALGNRSIVADARNKENWQRVNLKIKFRESFRPFAPTIMEEYLNEYFDIETPTPFMLMVAQVKKNTVPAITHVDNSARIQSVSRSENERYHKLISAFNDKTGTPVIINTSFNVRGEPIVCTPEDALKCFLRTDMDILVLGNHVIDKEQIDGEKLRDKINGEEKFDMD
ncbi:carbamoyltransferase [Patescibacteria group bacterium]|nr:carbamoyltransferase [Patescibacteria group bacterium]